MNKNTKIAITATLILAIITCVIVVVIVTIRKMNNSGSDSYVPVDSASDVVIKEGKVSLFTLADSEEEGRKIADELGIEFESYSYGVATFLTEKDPYDVIEAAKKRNLPDISINTNMYIQE